MEPTDQVTLEALLQGARIRAPATALGVTRIAAGPDGIAVTFAPGTAVAESHAETLERRDDAIEWNGERILLRKPFNTPEEARDLALDLLIQLT